MEAIALAARATSGDSNKRRQDQWIEALGANSSIAMFASGLKAEAFDIFEDLSLGKLPTVNVLKQDEVLKHCQDEWQPRCLVLSNTDLFVAHPGSDEVADKIPLHEIHLVTKIEDDNGDLAPEAFAFNVHTIKDGINCGREYCFQVEAEHELTQWITTLRYASVSANRKVFQKSILKFFKDKARQLSASKVWQRSNGFLVAGNFLINVAQSQAVSLGDDGSKGIFNALDTTFTIVFTIELSVHLFGYWFRRFFRDGWFVFDFIVVTISLASLIFNDLPGVTVLRLLRTFRVLRLFRNLRSLRTIINALASSLLPVMNAFLIVILVCAVYAILGVELFGDMKPAMFGSFSTSFWTMFQVSTFDGLTGLYRWVDKANQVSTESTPGSVDPVVACFMATFIAVVCWVLLPVVVAVLLDNFVSQVAFEKQKARIEEEIAIMKERGVSKTDNGTPLDPILQNLSHFRTSEDLSLRIQKLFLVLDVDRGGTLDFREMREGLRKMTNLKPHIYLSVDDFERMTKGGMYCDADGHLSPSNFEDMLRAQLDKYIEGKIAESYQDSIRNGRDDTTSLAALKILLMRTSQSVKGGVLPSDPSNQQAPNEPYKRTEIESALLGEFRDFRRELLQMNAEILEIKQVLQAGRNSSLLCDPTSFERKPIHSCEECPESFIKPSPVLYEVPQNGFHPKEAENSRTGMLTAQSQVMPHLQNGYIASEQHFSVQSEFHECEIAISQALGKISEVQSKVAKLRLSAPHDEEELHHWRNRAMHAEKQLSEHGLQSRQNEPYSSDVKFAKYTTQSEVELHPSLTTVIKERKLSLSTARKDKEGYAHSGTSPASSRTEFFHTSKRTTTNLQQNGSEPADDFFAGIQIHPALSKPVTSTLVEAGLEVKRLLGKGRFFMHLLVEAQSFETGEPILLAAKIPMVLAHIGGLPEARRRSEHEKEMMLRALHIPHVLSFPKNPTMARRHLLLNDRFLQASDGLWIALSEAWVSDLKPKDYIHSQPLHEIDILDFASQLCCALAGLARNGLVHGDVCPDNLLVRRLGNARLHLALTNFRTALPTTSADGQRTQILLNVASQGSNAPECSIHAIQHFSANCVHWRPVPYLDPRSDVWAAASLILSLVARRHPLEHLINADEDMALFACEITRDPAVDAGEAWLKWARQKNSQGTLEMTPQFWNVLAAMLHPIQAERMHACDAADKFAWLYQEATKLEWKMISDAT